VHELPPRGPGEEATTAASPPTLFANARSGLAVGSRAEILPDAGHFTHIERTDHVARLALEWSMPDK
jgi:pimeloyl-ACP methyl ester carboxylesterase